MASLVSDDNFESVYPSIITRIPPEILSEIFVWTEALYREEQGPRVTATYTPVYQLYRVCKSWREVVLDTPDLWTCVNIRGMRTLLRAEKWLGHAKNRLCTVWLSTNTGKFTSDVAFDLWTRHLDHIGYLELDFSQQKRPPSLHWPDIHSRLNTLVIRGLSLSSDDLSHVLSFNPLLERFEVDILSPEASERFETAIQPTRLTHLDLEIVDTWKAHELLQLLRSCPCLAFLHIEDGRLGSTDGGNRMLVELPELKVVSLPFSDLSTFLLPLLITPSLQELLFHQDESLKCEILEEELNNGTLAKRQKHLELGDPEILQDPNLGFFLRRLPRVEGLVVDVDDPDTSPRPLIEVLTIPDNDGTFVLPNLRELTLRNAAHWGGSLSGFERRYEGVPRINCQLPPPLKSIEIEDCWVTRGFNNLRRLCKKHGTKFSMWHPQIEFRWDRRLMSRRERDERDEWDEIGDGEAVQWDEEDDGGDGEEEESDGGEDTEGDGDESKEEGGDERDDEDRSDDQDDDGDYLGEGGGEAEDVDGEDGEDVDEEDT